MRFPVLITPLLGAAAAIGLAASAMAQTSYYGTPQSAPGTPPGAAPLGVPPYGSGALMPGGPPRTTYSGAPQPGPAGATGARPGNVVGTGNSLPLSDQASNMNQTDTRSPIAPRLPSPAVGPDAGTRQYLMAARTALAAGRTGEAQEALERAETRLLDRSVAPSRVNDALQGPGISDVTAARQALAARDRAGAIRIVDAALARR